MFDHQTSPTDPDVWATVTPLPPGGPTHAIHVRADAADADELAIAALDARAGELLADAMAALGSIPPATAGD